MRPRAAATTVQPPKPMGGSVAALTSAIALPAVGGPSLATRIDTAAIACPALPVPIATGAVGAAQDVARSTLAAAVLSAEKNGRSG